MTAAYNKLCLCNLSLQVAILVGLQVTLFDCSRQVAVMVCKKLSLQVAVTVCVNLSLQVAMILFDPSLQVAVVLTNCFMLVMVALLDPSLQVAVSQAYTWLPRKRLQMSLSVTASLVI